MSQIDLFTEENITHSTLRTIPHGYPISTIQTENEVENSSTENLIDGEQNNHVIHEVS